MPNPLPTKDSLAFGARLVQLMTHAQIERHGAGAYLAKRYKVSGVTANAWLDGEHKCRSNLAARIAADHGCTFESLYVGPDLVFTDTSRPHLSAKVVSHPLVSRGQVAGEDAIALQLAAQSLVTTMLNRLPGTADVFRGYLHEAAERADLRTDSGLLASFLEIADEALDAEAAAAHALQRSRDGVRTKPRK